MAGKALGRRTPLLRLRPVSAAVLVILTCAFVTLADNATHLRHAARIFEGAPLSWLRLELAIFGLFTGAMMVFTPRRLVRPALVILLTGSALAAHMTGTYDLEFDRRGIGDLLGMDLSDLRPLLGWGLARDLVLLGIVPAVLVMLVPLKPQGGLSRLFQALVIAAAGFGLCAAMLLSDYSRFVAVFREYPELMNRWVPGAPVAGGLSYARMALAADPGALRAVGQDARPGPWLAAPGKPVVAVLVLGNTSRAANWQLGGYARPTNPMLSRQEIIWFSDVTACATSDAAAVPCMVSDLPRARFSRLQARNRQNLLDVLKTAGFVVQWWDNTAGSDRVAARVARRELSQSSDQSSDRAACSRLPCDDRILLNELRRELPAIATHTVIVMRSAGSAGPAYYLRADPADAPFAPVCESAEFGKCSHEAIINSYDNSIAFTDRVLSGMIDLLASAQNVTPLLIYASDHGESLGEGGIWLHSAPWFMAPPEQTRVPMLGWLPPATRERLGIAAGCLEARAAAPLSHDNLFSTVLGLLDVETRVRDPGLDLTTGCRPARG